MLKWIILAVVILALIALVLANIRVVPQSKAFVLERLGTFYATWQTGLHVKIPFIDRIAKTVSLKEQVVDFKPQAVITKAPSAGLFEGQTDEEDMGVTYAAIDKYITTGEANEHDKAIIDRYHARSAHKRRDPLRYHGE